MKSAIKATVKKLLGENRVAVAECYFKVYRNRLHRTVSAHPPIIKGKVRTLRKLSVPGRHTFFGYYDITPFSQDNHLLLAMAAPDVHRTPLAGEEITIGYFDLRLGNHFEQVATTSTWCWQQGCRLQWFPKHQNECVIYNTMVDGIYGSVVQRIADKAIVSSYKWPVYALDNAGDWALSLNFSRLQRLRPGYGYVGIPDATKAQQCPEDDGVWRLNLQTGAARLIIRLSDLAQLQPLASMTGADHYINHLYFNPEGNRFMFFHLWTQGKRRYNRLLTCDLDGQQINILEDRDYVSHYAWKSNHEILATVDTEKGGMRYFLFDDRNGGRTPVAVDYLTVDGHPSYAPDNSLILTDTVLDKYGEQRLLLYPPSGTGEVLVNFFSPPKFRWEYRCDLHPRWDREGRLVCVDSAHEGQRAMYLLDTRETHVQP